MQATFEADLTPAGINVKSSGEKLYQNYVASKMQNRTNTHIPKIRFLCPDPAEKGRGFV